VSEHEERQWDSSYHRGRKKILFRGTLGRLPESGEKRRGKKNRGWKNNAGKRKKIDGGDRGKAKASMIETKKKKKKRFFRIEKQKVYGTRSGAHLLTGARRERKKEEEGESEFFIRTRERGVAWGELRQTPVTCLGRLHDHSGPAGRKID